MTGDDCVTAEYVEEDRVGRIYGRALLHAVRDTRQRAACAGD